MSTRQKTTEELLAMPDEEIDYSDIPPTDKEFWKHAELIKPEDRESISLRVPKDVLEWYRGQGKGYQTLMNSVLKTYVEARKQQESETRK